jgi:hypothetical protein
MAAAHGAEVAERHLIEALHFGAEAVEVLPLPAGGDRGQGAAMKRALEGDQAEALRRAVGRVVLARHLDRALQRLGAGVGEEHGFGKGRIDEPAGQPLAFGDAVEVGGMPQLPPLAHQGRHQMRMGMPRIDTAMPAPKSRYSTPSAVKMRAPSPRSKARSNLE